MLKLRFYTLLTVFFILAAASQALAQAPTSLGPSPKQDRIQERVQETLKAKTTQSVEQKPTTNQPANQNTAQKKEPEKQQPKTEPKPIKGTPVSFTVHIQENSPAIRQGVIWRIYSDQPDEKGEFKLIEQSDSASAVIGLQPGTYLVHVTYGRSTAAKKFFVTGTQGQTEKMVLNAGGLRISALIADDIAIPETRVQFDVFLTDPSNPSLKTKVASEVRPGRVVRLTAGTYNIVSQYGDANSMVRADNIRVESGKLTDATVYHNAAMITFKLVNEPGGEALANTSWSILTPGGDVVKESAGAFPTHVLASGTYSVIAKHEGQTFNREFSVEAGFDREIEVVAK